MSPLLILFSLLSVYFIANSVGIPLFLSILATGDALISFLATDDPQNRSPFSHRCSPYASSAFMTDLAIFLVSIVPLHPSLAPLRYPYMGRVNGKPLVEAVQARNWSLIVASKLFFARKRSSTNNWQFDLGREGASSFSK